MIAQSQQEWNSIIIFFGPSAGALFVLSGPSQKLRNLTPSTQPMRAIELLPRKFYQSHWCRVDVLDAVVVLLRRSFTPSPLITMNVVQSRPSRSRVTEEKTSKKAQTVDFYDNVPQYELSLDEFEEYALARLKVILNYTNASFSYYSCLVVNVSYNEYTVVSPLL